MANTDPRMNPVLACPILTFMGDAIFPKLRDRFAAVEQGTRQLSLLSLNVARRQRPVMPAKWPQPDANSEQKKKERNARQQ